MIPAFDTAAGWIQETLLLPVLFSLGLIQWEDISFGWALVGIVCCAVSALGTPSRPATRESALFVVQPEATASRHAV